MLASIEQHFTVMDSERRRVLTAQLGAGVPWDDAVEAADDWSALTPFDQRLRTAFCSVGGVAVGDPTPLGEWRLDDYFRSRGFEPDDIEVFAEHPLVDAFVTPVDEEPDWLLAFAWGLELGVLSTSQ